MAERARRRRRAMIVAVVAALALVVVGNVVAGLAGAQVHWWRSLGTAAIVGGFLALILFRPRNREDEPKGTGFTVESREER